MSKSNLNKNTLYFRVDLFFQIIDVSFPFTVINVVILLRCGFLHSPEGGNV